MDDLKIDEELLIPVGRHTLPAEEVSERQRERLLRATAACVSARGYRNTTIADIVSAARTSRSAFYEHFTDKEECFLEAYEQMAAAFIEASLEAAAGVSEWQAKLEVGISTYFRWMAQHPQAAVSTVVEIHNAGHRGLEARGQALKQWMRTIEGVAILARRAGVKMPPLDEVVYVAIILTAEAYVHDYARRGCVDQVAEKAPAVQALARTLFEHGVPSV
jgi:AcrR family transcriptional regulator